MSSAYIDGLKMLARRELSEQQVRQRLARKQYSQDDIDEAVARLRAERAIDDQRVAEAIARTETAHPQARPGCASASQLERAGIAHGDRPDGDRRRVRRDRRRRAARVGAAEAAARARDRSPTIASSRGCIRYLIGQGFESDRVMTGA